MRFEAAIGDTIHRVLPGSEQEVPERQAVVVGLVVPLVMDAVHFRTLDEDAQPARGIRVRVDVEVVGGSQEQANAHGFDIEAKDQEPGYRSDDRRHEGVERMHEERRVGFDAVRTVM